MTWRKLAVSRGEVEIATVLMAGQSFRWKRNESNPEEFIGVFGHNLWTLKQDDHHIHYKIINPPTEATESESEQKLINYFQLQIQLLPLYKKWSEKDPKFAKLISQKNNGIRILGQDPIENIFSFICSSNNNIARISQMVEKLCFNYGEKICDYGGRSYFDFPLVDKLIGGVVEKKLREEGFGYRAGFIVKSAGLILEKGGLEWVEGLRRVGYEEARGQLMGLVGVGRKVADCICLMSLGYPEAIPIDTHMHQIAAEDYLPHLSKVKLNQKVYSEITGFFRDLYGGYAGWAHAVLFASRLSNKASKNKRKRT